MENVVHPKEANGKSQQNFNSNKFYGGNIMAIVGVGLGSSDNRVNQAMLNAFVVHQSKLHQHQGQHKN